MDISEKTNEELLTLLAMYYVERGRSGDKNHNKYEIKKIRDEILKRMSGQL